LSNQMIFFCSQTYSRDPEGSTNHAYSVQLYSMETKEVVLRGGPPQLMEYKVIKKSTRCQTIHI
jgi:hypothetical protein